MNKSEGTSGTSGILEKTSITSSQSSQSGLCSVTIFVLSRLMSRVNSIE